MNRHREWMQYVGLLSLLLAYDPTQSTGSGTQQGPGASLHTSPEMQTDSKSGKNEDSGSATGAVRDRSQSGVESGSSHGSRRSGSTGPGTESGSTSGRSMGESGAGTTSGAGR
ncbi:MAG TPA: hypothetical protein VJ692_02630 [Nitrospiraceae bacterium]|nr:hypothetical protein [Nitrospiraceae bacterium]